MTDVTLGKFENVAFYADAGASPPTCTLTDEAGVVLAPESEPLGAQSAFLYEISESGTGMAWVRGLVLGGLAGVGLGIALVVVHIMRRVRAHGASGQI